MFQYILNEKGFAKVPGMQEYAVELVDVDILECLTFPWQLRLVEVPDNSLYIENVHF